MAKDVRQTLNCQTELLSDVRAELSRVLVGLDPVIEQVFASFLAGGHALLEGVPGIGKTLLVRTLGEALDLTFRRIQLTPDLMPADITGTNMIVSGDEGKTIAFQEGPVFGNLILADEINRATPKTQAALLESMGEGQVTVSGKTRPLPDPFFVLATQNPIEMEGTYPLPEAELDRFLLKIEVGAPNAKDLLTILEQGTSAPPRPVKKILSADQVRSLRSAVRDVVAPSGVLAYAVSLIQNLTPDSNDREGPRDSLERISRLIRYGPGPRGALALILGGKALALLRGRSDLSYEDVADLAPAALRHRILLSFEAEAEGVTANDIIEEALKITDRAPQSIRRWQEKLS